MISNIKNRITHGWLLLQYREQVAVLMCGISIVLFCCYIMVALPLVEFKNKSQRQLRLQEAKTQRIEALLSEIRSQTIANTNDTTQSTDIRSRLVELAEENSLRFDRIQSNNDKLEFYLSADPDMLMKWLAVVRSELRAEPSQVSIKKTEGANPLSIKVSFKISN